MDSEQERLSTGMQIGDYLLKELLYDGETARSWLAEQVSVGREVIVDSLNWEQQADEAYIASFLSDVRAKAAVDFPLIGSVFEAVRDERHCFYARENLLGRTLQDLLDAGEILTPYSVAHILRQLAESNLYLEEHNIDTLPLLTDKVFISEHSLCRIVNMAVGGERDHSVSTADKHLLATALIPLLETDAPGSTRTRSLLNFMADLEREVPITWAQVRDHAEGIEHHIASPTEQISNTTTKLHKPSTASTSWLKAAILLLFFGAAAYGILQLQQQPVKQESRELDTMVHVPAGDYSNHEEDTVSLQEFWIDAHEVTIAEYAEFLAALDILTAEEISVYQHPEQPKEKSTHTPDEWSTLYQQATQGGKWHGRSIDPNHPVVGVDWWDAYAYSNFRRRQLPSSAQWIAALRYGSRKNESPAPSGWGPVDQTSPDITETSIHGLTGNVSEWSGSLDKDPSSPTKPKMPVILGGSFRTPQNSAVSREWLSVDARNTRRFDLGFRTISKSAPAE